MGRAYDGKKRWTETVLRAGRGATSAASSNTGGNGRKRFSGRKLKLSAAMRRVDDETRAIVRNARLDALEGDGGGTGGGAEDEDAASDGAYVDEEDGGASKDKKAARSRSKKVAVGYVRLFGPRITRKEAKEPTSLSLLIATASAPRQAGSGRSRASPSSCLKSTAQLQTSRQTRRQRTSQSQLRPRLDQLGGSAAFAASLRRTRARGAARGTAALSAGTSTKRAGALSSVYNLLSLVIYASVGR